MNASAKSSESSQVVERARFEGVSRPFQILCRMASDLRSELAALLGMALRPGEAIVEAWEIIHRDLRGLQARTHSIPERVAPFSRNNSWNEILLRTAHRLQVPVDRSLSVSKLERVIFDCFTRSLVGKLGADEAKAVNELSDRAPALYYSLANSGISTDGIRVILAGILRATARAGWTTREGILRAADWINERVASGAWTPSISRGLSASRVLLREAVRGWRDSGLLDRLFRGQERRTVPVIATIYIEGTVDENLDEMRFLPETC